MITKKYKSEKYFVGSRHTNKHNQEFIILGKCIKDYCTPNGKSYPRYMCQFQSGYVVAVQSTSIKEGKVADRYSDLSVKANGLPVSANA
jgi:hypothetical protein